MNYKLALGVLAKWKVEFVLVGGAAVVAHGSTLSTQDLDIVYRVDSDNVRKLLGALGELGATAYGDPRGLSFGFDHLNNHGHHLNDTRAGRIDVLGSIGIDGQVHYEHLAEDAVALQVFGVEVKCISLDRLIAIKKELARPRDKIAVLELEAIKKLRQTEFDED
jgi:predicted nucleotidyltransferase